MVQTRRSPALTGRCIAYILIGMAGLMSGCGRKPQAPPPQPAAAPPPKPAAVL
ncbi:MAG: hypothetical protein JF615_07185, partial [Asticcacaulis sp.]|nr:hypothetical protein [Asticcacaulis sp.]